MLDPGLAASLAASCVGLSVLVLVAWGLAVHRMRVHELVGRLQAAQATIAHAGQSGLQRGMAGWAKRYLGLDLPSTGLWALFGLSAVLGLGFAELLGLWGWHASVAAAGGPVVLIAWRLNVTGRRGEVLARQAHTLLQEMQLATAGGDNAVRSLSVAAEHAKDPLRQMLGVALRAHAAGEPLVSALSRLHEVASCPEYRLLLDALRLHADTECSLGQLLGEAVERADEALLSHRELAAKLSEARWTAWILALIPVSLLGYMAMFNPWAIAPLREDPVGRHGLFLGGVLWLCGIAATARMQRPPDSLRPGV
ncbi:MAG: hypothetical protein Q8P31_04390 [Bacillota bacterium]|nr:hypothetical protein [Bacillota bacterium]